MSDARQVRSLLLFEGQVQWIMERETAEEKLAAWETVAALAFPHGEGEPAPPELPNDGSKLSPCDRVRRDAFLLFKDVIEARAAKVSPKEKNTKKVEAGRIGAARRYGYSSDGLGDDVNGMDAIQNEAVLARVLPQTPPNEDKKEPVNSHVEEVSPVQEKSHILIDDPEIDDIEPYVPTEPPVEDVPKVVTLGYGRKRKLSPKERQVVADYDKRFPNVTAFQDFLKENYLLGNRDIVVSDDFCAYAYNKIAKQNRWISTKSGTPLRDFSYAVHYIALEYQKLRGDIRRLEAEEHQKDIDSEMRQSVSDAEAMSPSDIAAIERKRRRAAEKEAAKKLMEGRS